MQEDCEFLRLDEIVQNGRGKAIRSLSLGHQPLPLHSSLIPENPSGGGLPTK